jgi:hypothetical protein
MSISFYGTARHGLAVYTRRAGTTSALQDPGPLVSPLDHLDRLLFHSQLGYLVVRAYQQPVRVVLPGRSGSGTVVWRPSPWPARHGGGSRATGILLIGPTQRAAAQHVLGDVTPKGYSGRKGARWRRLAITVGRTDCRLAEVWQTAGPADGMTAEVVYVGYLLVEAVDPQARDRAIFIGRNRGKPYIQWKSFDTRNRYLAVLSGRSGFWALAGANIAGKGNKGVAITQPAGGIVRRGPSPGAVVAAKPPRFRLAAR